MKVLELDNLKLTHSIPNIDIEHALIYDSHLLKTYRACGRKFQLFEEQHWVPKVMGPAPAFGIAMHEGIAAFRAAKHSNANYPDAFAKGAQELLAAYKKHMPPDSQTEVMQDDKRSPRNALRIFQGYCEHYEPLSLNFPYVEVPFAMLLGQIPTSNGKTADVIYVGIIDAIIEWQNRLYVNDLKTTGWTISQGWLDGFQMDQGMIGYMLAARELLGIDTQHGVVHAMWIQSPPKSGKGKPLDEYFHTKELYWDKEQIDEWTQNTLNTVMEIEMRKQDHKWVMDFGQNCGAFGGCAYRPVCATTPNGRQHLLELDFERKIWTPLEDERLQKMEV